VPEPSPLLPWKLATLLVLILALVTDWRLAWDPFAPDLDPTAYVLAGLPERAPDRYGVLFVGNSRLGFAMQHKENYADVLDAAGIPDAQHGMVWGPHLRFSDLRTYLTPIARFGADLLVVQADLFVPMGPGAEAEGYLHALRSFEPTGRELIEGLEFVQLLEPERIVIVDLPYPDHVVSQLGVAWQADRAAALEALEARGFEVVAADAPWPDDRFNDEIHYGPGGEIALRRWLGAHLAEP